MTESSYLQANAFECALTCTLSTLRGTTTGRPTDASCRFDRVLPRSDSPKAEGSTTEPHGIFSGMTLMLVGKLEGSKTEWTKKIEEAGGVVVGSVDARCVAAVGLPAHTK